MKLVSVTLILLSLRSVTGTCIPDASVRTCDAARDTIGDLSMDCSGEDYIVTLSVEHEELFALTIMAECSTSCSDTDSLYYYDLSSYSSVDATFNRTFNGSSKLGMPSTLKSSYCKVFGCYKFGRIMYRLSETTCFSSNRTTAILQTEFTTELTTAIPQTEFTTELTTAIPQTEFTTEFTTELKSTEGVQFITEASGDYDDNNNVTASNSSNAVMEEDDLFSAIPASSPITEDAIVAMVIVGIFIVCTLLALLLMILCYRNIHRNNQSHKMKQPNIEGLYDADPNDDLMVDINGESLFPLSSATSQITIYNGFSESTAMSPHKPTILSFDREASYSLVSSSYFKMGDVNSPLSACEMSLSDRSDMSSAGSKSDFIAEMMLEDEQLSENELVQGKTDMRKPHCGVEQCSNMVDNERLQGSMASSAPLPHRVELTDEGAQEFESGSGEVATCNHLESEIMYEGRKQSPVTSGYIANEQSVVNFSSLETAIPSQVTKPHNLATGWSEYLPSETGENAIKTKVLTLESGNTTFVPAAEHGYVDNAGIHVNPVMSGDQTCSMQLNGSGTVLDINHAVMTSSTEMSSDYLPNTTKIAVIPARDMAKRNFADNLTDEQGYLEEFNGSCRGNRQSNTDQLQVSSMMGANEWAQPVTTAELGTNSGNVSNISGHCSNTIVSKSVTLPQKSLPLMPSISQRGSSVKTITNSNINAFESKSDYISNGSNFVLNNDRCQHQEDGTMVTDLILEEEFSCQGDSCSSLPAADGVSDSTHVDYVSFLPSSCEDHDKPSLQSSHWRKSPDELSLNLEGVEYSSEKNRNSDSENTDNDYSSSDDEIDSDDSNEANESMEMSIEDINSRGYIRSDLTMDSDSIQFYFPLRNAAGVHHHHQPHGLYSEHSNNDNSSSSPDYPNVSDYHFNYPTSGLGGDQLASFGMSPSDMSPKSDFTSSSDLELAQHHFVTPLDLESTSSRKRSLINTKLNVINYSFDREDDTDCMDGNDSDVNFSFT